MTSSAFEVRLSGWHIRAVGLPRRDALLLSRAVHDYATRAGRAQPLIIGVPLMQADSRDRNGIPTR
ncbi:MAG: hypothetical protein OXN89_14045 [Bryobacterales bacterium]|nr:hypothetical protein [Bryobacterales bacterium]